MQDFRMNNSLKLNLFHRILNITVKPALAGQSDTDFVSLMFVAV